METTGTEDSSIMSDADTQSACLLPGEHEESNMEDNDSSKWEYDGSIPSDNIPNHN